MLSGQLADIFSICAGSLESMDRADVGAERKKMSTSYGMVNEAFFFSAMKKRVNGL